MNFNFSVDHNCSPVLNITFINGTDVNISGGGVDHYEIIPASSMTKTPISPDTALYNISLTINSTWNASRWSVWSNGFGNYKDTPYNFTINCSDSQYANDSSKLSPIYNFSPLAFTILWKAQNQPGFPENVSLYDAVVYNNTLYIAAGPQYTIGENVSTIPMPQTGALLYKYDKSNNSLVLVANFSNMTFRKNPYYSGSTNASIPAYEAAYRIENYTDPSNPTRHFLVVGTRDMCPNVTEILGETNKQGNETDGRMLYTTDPESGNWTDLWGRGFTWGVADIQPFNGSLFALSRGSEIYSLVSDGSIDLNHTDYVWFSCSNGTDQVGTRGYALGVAKNMLYASGEYVYSGYTHPILCVRRTSGNLSTSWEEINASPFYPAENSSDFGYVSAYGGFTNFTTSEGNYIYSPMWSWAIGAIIRSFDGSNTTVGDTNTWCEWIYPAGESQSGGDEHHIPITIFNNCMYTISYDDSGFNNNPGPSWIHMYRSCDGKNVSLRDLSEMPFVIGKTIIYNNRLHLIDMGGVYNVSFGGGIHYYRPKMYISVIG